MFMRVCFYLRILPLTRPLMIADLKERIASAFGQHLCMNYENGQVRAFVYWILEVSQILESICKYKSSLNSPHCFFHSSGYVPHQ